MKQDEFFNLMNQYGKEARPFLFVCDFDMEKPLIFPIDEVPDNEILFDINGYSNVENKPLNNTPLEFSKTPVSFDRYKKAFDLVQYHLRRGDSYLLNLTFPSKININLCLEEVFHRAKARYKLCIKDHCAVYSPEVFVQIKEGKIFSHPMKGTIDAAIENAEQIILDDEKEQAEHVTIVDLIRNDLNRVSKRVRVDRFRYVDHLQSNDKNLLQVSSQISGDLETGYEARLGDIFRELLPAGSISGAPKRKTVEVIKNAEQYNRGYYTGVFGYFDGKNVDSGVMIRYIEKEGDGFIYKSGGGITLKSDVETEYKELIDKVYVPFF